MRDGDGVNNTTTLNLYLHVRFENTATFFSVLYAHMMYRSIANDCKKSCMANFFKIPFFYHDEVQVAVSLS